MSDLLQRLAGLPPEKRVLLERLLKEQAERLNIFPASFAQRRLWFLDQWEPGSPVYHLAAVLQLTGDLDVAALEQSLDLLVTRHEALRTTFALLDGQPVQQIQPPVPLALPHIDLQDLPSDVQAARLAALTRQLATEPFDLARGPLLHLALVQLAPTHHQLLITFHHIAVDGWSLDVLVRELAASYLAFQTG